MNRIVDERVRFYLQHARQIDEWAALESDACKFVDQFYLSVQDPIARLVEHGSLDDDIETFIRDLENPYPQIGLRRKSWPRGGSEPCSPRVVLEWRKGKTTFHGDCWRICGLFMSDNANRKAWAEFLTKERRPTYPRSSDYFGAYRSLSGREVWKDEHIDAYRSELAETVRKAFCDLAPLVDEYLGHLRRSDASRAVP